MMSVIHLLNITVYIYNSDLNTTAVDVETHLNSEKYQK